MAAKHFGLRAQQRLAELVDHAGPTQVLERVVGRASRDDRAVRELVARTMVVRDDDVEPELTCAPDFVDRRDAAGDRQDEPTALLREPLQRLTAAAVALVEAARPVPRDPGAELAQPHAAEPSGADPVDVVVAVHAD